MTTESKSTKLIIISINNNGFSQFKEHGSEGEGRRREEKKSYSRKR